MKILFVLLALSYSAHTESLNPFFTQINTGQGLSHRKVNCILQDKRGFLWFGTEDGLNRYDGRYFVNYSNQPNVASTLSGNIIKDLYEDKDGVIWIATADGGMTKYDYRLPPLKQFRQFRHNIHDQKSIPENGLSKITEDNFGYLWLATSGSFAVRFNKKTEKFDIPVKKGTRCIYALAMGNSDTLWVGRAGGGLLKINTRTLAFKVDPNYEDLYASLPHVSITSIFKDNSNNFWLGSWDKLVYRFSQKGNVSVAVNPNKPGKEIDDFVSFAEDKQHRIWMAGKNTGIKVFDQNSKLFNSFEHDPQQAGSISDNHVNAIYIDRNQVIWVATDNGVNMYNPLFSGFVQYHLPQRSTDILIYDFYKDNDDKLWIGTSDGIYTRKKGSSAFEHREITFDGQKLAVTKFFKDIDGRFYIGTNYTLFRYIMDENRVVPLPNTESDPVMRKLINSKIVSIVRDSIGGHPVLIVSPYGHYLTYYDLAESKWVSRADSVKKILKKFNIKDNLVRKLYKDKKNNLWLATAKHGLGTWKPENAARYYQNDLQSNSSLTCNDIFDIKEDKSGNFWISTYGGGMNFFNLQKDKFSHLSESSNLSEGFQLDKRENLWMICNGHIHKYDTVQKIYGCYDLPRLHNTSGLSGYLYKDNEGTMYVGGKNYYVTFIPDSIAGIMHEPDIYFTDFKIFNQSYSHYLGEKPIKLDHSQNLFTIEYAAPEYNGENLQYAYILEGVDAHWINAGKINQAQYSNLKEGKYLFKVRATNWKDSYKDKYSSILIIITPPFWLTTWFYMLVVILILTIAYGIYHYRVKNLLKQQAIRNGIAQDLHDQIGSTLSSISVYGAVAKIYLENNEKKQLDGVLDTISSTANEMVTEMADIVWAINPKNDNLESVLNRIRHYAKPLCNIMGIKFAFNCDSKLADMNVGMKMRQNIYLIIKESISNAVKHAECTNLTVNMSLNDDMAELSIIDDGIGFVMQRPDQSASFSGNGLINIQSRAKELDAKIEIESETGLGTLIRIVFRIKN